MFLIVTPILLLLSVVYVRVLLEIVVVLFKISDNTAETVRLLAGREDDANPHPTVPPGTGGTTGGSADTHDEGRTG